MNNNIPAHPPDGLDRLLSEYFRAQLPTPWPAVRVPQPTVPSAVSAFRNAESAGDAASRARWTLAASAALLLGTCWYLSGGFAPTRGVSTPATTPAFNGASAESEVLDTIERLKVTDPPRPKPAPLP